MFLHIFWQLYECNFSPLGDTYDFVGGSGALFAKITWQTLYKNYYKYTDTEEIGGKILSYTKQPIQ